MPHYNKTLIMGHLTRDVEIRYAPSGAAIGKFGIASNRTWKSENGEKKEEVVFVDVTAFGKQAETLAQYVKKGSALFVEGRLKADEWTDKQTNQKRSKLGVVLEGFQFIGGKEGSAGGSTASPASKPATEPASKPATTPAADSAEDDVPF